MYLEAFERIVAELPQACRQVYGQRLRALAVFGSVARGTPRPDSDIDLLLVVDDLPAGRRVRMDEFETVDRLLDPLVSAAQAQGVYTTLSPVLKTPQELDRGSLLDLDMIDEARILLDPDQVLRRHLQALSARLATLGARKVERGGGYYWELKPDYRWGERITL
jgi:predicted nucleotidyltransferase